MIYRENKNFSRGETRILLLRIKELYSFIHTNNPCILYLIKVVSYSLYS